MRRVVPALVPVHRLNPKMPKRPQRVNLDVERSRNFFAHEFIEPEDPTERPRVARTAGQRAVGQHAYNGFA